MIRQSVINRINRYAKKRGLEITEMKEIKSTYNRGYKFNRVEFTILGNSRYWFYEMECNKRHWFIV